MLTWGKNTQHTNIALQSEKYVTSQYHHQNLKKVVLQLLQEPDLCDFQWQNHTVPPQTCTSTKSSVDLFTYIQTQSKHQSSFLVLNGYWEISYTHSTQFHMCISDDLSQQVSVWIDTPPLLIKDNDFLGLTVVKILITHNTYTTVPWNKTVITS